MARLVRNARIYSELGELVHHGDLRDPIPDWLRQNTFYILSENSEPKQTYSLDELMQRKIAVFRNGVFHIDPPEWNRNYGSRR